MTIPQDPSDSEFTTTSWQRLPRARRVAIGSGVTGALLLVVTVLGYVWIDSSAKRAASDSIAEGYYFMTIFLILPCVFGVGLLIVAAIAAVTGRASTPPNA